MAKSTINSTARVDDPRYITLTDLSVYNPDVPVTNAIYRITIVNFNKFVDIPYTPGEVLNVNSNMLGLTNSATVEGLCDIPSGQYLIRQSICPNDKLYYEYKLFNVTPDLLKVARMVCSAECDEAVIAEAYDIKKDLEVAKMLGEVCCSDKEAAALYNSAARKLNNNKKYCC